MPFLRMAWRDLRASPGRFAFVVLAVAVGVGSLTGVRAFSRAFRSMLLDNARTLMAGDMSLRIFGLPTPEQERVLKDLEARGVRRTWITETVTMAASAAVPEPLLVSIKAVDPDVYPFYGVVKLNPPGALGPALRAGTAVVSEDLLMRLKVRPGDSVRLGGQDFRIAAVLAGEPDRMTGSLNVGPRVLISRAGLQRTGLISLGSRASERFVFRLPAGGPGVAQVRAIFKRTFPEATIADYRETHPIITRGLDRATTFLSLVSLIALIVGALGVGTAIDAHLRQKMDTIAILKCVGARSGQVLRIYVAQTALLGLAGGVLGVALGFGVAQIFPLLIARFFPSAPPLRWDAVPAFQGLAAGFVTTLLFTIPPLLGVRGIRPNVIFRREMAETQPAREWKPAVIAGIAILLGVAAIAVWLVEGSARDKLRMGTYFAAGLAAAMIALALAARLLLWALRAVVRRVPLAATVRHGLSNLYRPGAHATTVLVALGVGVMFTLTVYLLQHSLLAQIGSSMPPGMPNVFLLDIPAAQRDAASSLAARQPGVERPPEITAAVAVRLTAVNGRPVEQLGLHQFGRRFLRTRNVTWLRDKPGGAVLLSGKWWDPAHPPSDPQACVQEDAARTLRLAPGAVLDFQVWGRALRVRVACIHRAEAIRMSTRFEFILSPGVLDGFPAIYYGSVRVRPRDVAAFQRALYERYPTVTVINVADVLEIVQQVVDQIASVYRFLSLFTILAGAIILASGVAIQSKKL